MSGKKYADAIKRYNRDDQYAPTEALALVKSMASAKFDETVEIAIRLGVDPRKAEQAVRGTVALPSGTGKNLRIAVFAAGDAAEEARQAGADLVGADDLAAEIEKGNFDFDLAIATPDMMPLVGRLGRVLGPRGLMPNPKTGTVTQDVGRAHRISAHLQYGCTWVNTHFMLVSEMPHGGMKMSGYGKDMSVYGLEDYTVVRHVMIKH